MHKISLNVHNVGIVFHPWNQ